MPVIYDWHNIDSELMRRYAANSGSPARRLYASLTARRLASVERQVLREGFGHLVCSERERLELQRLAPAARIAVVENGVDAASFRDTDLASGPRHRILFVGHMAYSANIESAIPFVRDIWPLIRERFPSWILTLAGSSPPPSILALRSERNVEVTGTVPDLKPYYREAVAAIIPLRIGGGTRLKILEAMAAGVPVVSTPIGAEGLKVSPGVDLLLASSAQDWLSHLAALAPQDALWTGLARAGRQFAERYDWEVLGNSLCSTYSTWFPSGAAASAGGR
jgi:glycosyltransferase involved in cell wall biosynthesis